MNESRNLRKNTRTVVWDDIIATVIVNNPLGQGKESVLKIEGDVKDIGAQGMFFLSDELIPIGSKADIIIEFDPRERGKLRMTAQGKTIRVAPGGVGIRFTKINLQRLQECITGRMNI